MGWEWTGSGICLHVPARKSDDYSTRQCVRYYGASKSTSRRVCLHKASVGLETETLRHTSSLSKRERNHFLRHHRSQGSVMKSESWLLPNGFKRSPNGTIQSLPVRGCRETRAHHMPYCGHQRPLLRSSKTIDTCITSYNKTCIAVAANASARAQHEQAVNRSVVDEAA